MYSEEYFLEKQIELEIQALENQKAQIELRLLALEQNKKALDVQKRLAEQGEPKKSK